MSQPVQWRTYETQSYQMKLERSYAIELYALPRRSEQEGTAGIIRMGLSGLSLMLSIAALIVICEWNIVAT